MNGTGSRGSGGSNDRSHIPVSQLPSHQSISDFECDQDTTSQVLEAPRLSISAAPLVLEASAVPADAAAITRQGNTHVDESRLLLLLECNICTENMYPPIFQCREGHALCAECRDKVTRCPICQSPSIEIRNRCLEELAECITMTGCRYREFGCHRKMKYTDKKAHERACDFGPLFCLHYGSSCRVKGSDNDIVKHLLADHGYAQYITDEVDFECTHDNATDLGDDKWTWQCAIFSCHGSHFALRVRRVEDEIYISLLECNRNGPSHPYLISVKGKNRECSYEGVVMPFRMGFREVEKVHDCLIVKTNIAMFCSGGTGGEESVDQLKLRVTGRIFPSCPSSSILDTPVSEAS